MTNIFNLINPLSLKKDKINELYNLYGKPINSIKNHYLCTKCLIFPYIKFCKDKRYIRVTCSCFNNEKMLIKDLLERNNLSIENYYKNFILEFDNKYIIKKNKFLCKKHKEKYIGFSKIIFDNYCQSCVKFKNDSNDIILFDDIQIEDKRIEQLLKLTNNKESNKNKFIKNNNGCSEILSEEDEEKFNNLVNIILYDYINYPSFSHFFNIKNLLNFFNIEDKQKSEKEGKKFINKNIKNNEPIIIKYNNNTSSKTKLFSKTFVKYNKNNFKIEIEGKRTDLIEEYEFKGKEKKVI